MSIKTQYDFLFVGKNDGGFVENYAYDLGEGGENSGKFFINLEIQQNNFDAEKIGEIIFDTMRRVFFAEPEADPYVRFEESLKEINRALNAFRQERGNEFLGKLNIVIAAIVDSNLYLTQTGEAEAYLIRKRLATTITDDLDEASLKEVFTNIASGDLENGDFVLICTTRLIRYIAKAELGKMVGGDLAKSVSQLKEQLLGEVLSKIGMIGIKVQETRKAADDEVIEPDLGHLKEESYQSFENTKGNLEKGNSLQKFQSWGGSVLNSGKSWFHQFSKRAGKLNLNSNRDEEGGFSWSKETVIIGTVAMVVLLSVGVWWLRGKGAEEEQIKLMASKLVQANEMVSSAITTGQYDKEKASELLANAEKIAIEIYNSDYHKPKAREVLDKIVSTRDLLDGVLRPELAKVASLVEKRANVDASGLLLLNKQLYAYEYNALYPVLAGQVQSPLTIDDNEKVISGVNYDDKDSVLFLTEGDKVIEYVNDRMNFLPTSDQKFKDAKAIKAYKNKIYLLDPVGNQIWRYNRTRDKFETAQPYAVGADLTKAVDLAIDGNVYVLSSDGKIQKLFQGKVDDNFKIVKEPAKPLTAPTKIYTELDMNQIFVLEPAESRVLMYLKDARTGNAVYTSQFSLEELKDIRDIVADKETNTLYVLTKTEIHSLKY